ncbi:MAG: GNAT family N-acetyltransferase [Bacteroidota bacterium]
MQPISCTLPDGLEVTIRSVTPDDREHFPAGMRALSARSRYHRFNTYRNNLTEAQIRYLTEIDQVNHVALCVSCTTDAEEIGIGVGRFVRQPANKQQAELALTVIDAYQKQGVGTLLMAALCRLASAQNISTFTLRIHANRFALIKRLAALDARVVAHQQGVLEMELPVVKQDILQLYTSPQAHQVYQQVYQAFSV